MKELRSRRQFLKTVATLPLLGAAAGSLLPGLTGCGDDSSDDLVFEGADLSSKRLDPDPRKALVKEFEYALGTGSNTITCWGGTWRVGSWNYVKSDQNARGWLVGQYGPCASMWRCSASDHSHPAANSKCSPYKSMGPHCFYRPASSNSYGDFGGYGRGCQCQGFVCLLCYRSAVRQTQGALPTYADASYDYGHGRSYTKDSSQCLPGDILYRKNGNHTALVLSVLSGTPGQSVTAVDVGDSNLVTFNPTYLDEEIIARHIMENSTRFGTLNDLRLYYALDLLKIGGK